MRIKFRLKSVKQLLNYIHELTDQQKLAFRALLKNVSESQQSSHQGMPSLISGTGRQWGEYLSRQKPLLDRLTVKTGRLIPINEYRFLIRDHQVIDLAQHINQGTGYWRLVRRALRRNPLLEILVACRIIADQYISYRDVYDQLVGALADLAKPSVTLSSKLECLAMIEHRMMILAYQFSFKWLDTSLVNQVISEVHQCFYQIRDKGVDQDQLVKLQPLRSSFRDVSCFNSVLYKVVSRALSNHDDAWLRQFACDVDRNFSETFSVEQFMNQILSNPVILDGLQLFITNRDLKQLIRIHNAGRAYRLAKRYPNLIHRVLYDLATLNSMNEYVKISDITDVVERIPQLRDHSIVRKLVNCAEQSRHNYQNGSIHKFCGAFVSLINNPLYVSSLFTAVINQVVNSKDTSAWRNLIDFIRTDLKESNNLRAFISRILDRIGKRYGRITNIVNYYLVLALKFSDNYEISAIYNVVHDQPDVGDTILDSLASLNKQTEVANLKRIAEKIQRSRLKFIRITRIIATSAWCMASKDQYPRYLNERDDAHWIFDELINRSDYISLLFMVLVNRLTSSKASLKLRRIIEFVGFDFNQSRKYQLFIKRFARLISGAHGPVLDLINYLTGLVLRYPNRQLKRLYQYLYEYRRFTVNLILKDLIYLRPANKYHQLDKLVRSINNLDLNSVNVIDSLSTKVSQMSSSRYRDTDHNKMNPDNNNRYVKQRRNASTDHLLSNLDQLINDLNNEIHRS